MTHRQYEVWKRWLREQWQVPDRTDQYLMQIACEVRRGYVKHPGKVSVRQMKLQFGVSDGATGNGSSDTSSNGNPPVNCSLSSQEIARERATKWAQSKWLGGMTAPVKRVVRRDKE